MNEILAEYADDLLRMKEKISNSYWQDRQNISIDEKVLLEDIVIHLDAARNICADLTNNKNHSI